MGDLLLAFCAFARQTLLLFGSLGNTDMEIRYVIEKIFVLQRKIVGSLRFLNVEELVYSPLLAVRAQQSSNVTTLAEITSLHGRTALLDLVGK